MGDAIGRTLYRLFVTRRHLLEWVTAAQAQLGAALDLAGFYRRMAGARRCRRRWRRCRRLARRPARVAARRCRSLLLWLASPAIARWVEPAAARRRRMADLATPTRARCG